MIAKVWKHLLLTSLSAILALGQNFETGASKDDWEEINFEVNSAILTDGFPSLLRLAELLKRNPPYKVKVTGHCDDPGTNRQCDKLANQRAEAVKAFLVKYGASPGQIETAGEGRRQPKASGRSPEARFVNRRVHLTVTDGTGKVVGDGGVADAIDALMKAMAKKQEECCDNILKRLDRLDEIAAMLRDMKGENAALRRELDALKAAQAAAQASTEKKIAELPKPLTSGEVTSITEKTADEAIKRNQMPRFTLLGVNVGADDSGKLTFSGKGRYFAPFKENFAIQAQAEYLYFRDRKEGQFDLGIVNRYKNVQGGLFASFKNVQVNELRNGGTLGQGALTFDYIFSRGKVGIFGTKAFLDNVILNRTALTRTLEIQTLLKAVDQIGAQTTLGLVKNTYLEGNLGYLKSYGAADRMGGTLRFVFPLNDFWAFTLEGDMNPTMLSTRGQNGRVVAGIQFGNFLRPKEFKGISHPVPVDVPRVRYELITRRVRNGNDAPVADAGPDQLGVSAGLITLDGSGSFDPEGDAITYEWRQVAGPSVSIAGATTARAAFTAAEGQSYAFRLTVSDDKGASAIDRVEVTVARTPQVRIARFQANPQQIRAGESSTLTWQVDNADEVVIDGIGTVNPNGGSTNVAPDVTTSYRLTARNRAGEVSETATVTVIRPEVRIVFFTASPMTISAGQSSTLSWQTENADSVEISGVGGVAQSGSQVVTPGQTTSYVITARNRFGQTTSQVAVQVNPAPMPRVVRFTAAPIEIVSGEQSSLVWQVENATDVTISPELGEVALTGSANVQPTQTTTYTLTARNASGTVTAQATVTVFPAVRIISFTATPATSPSPGSPVTLSWTTEGATEVFLEGLGAVNANGSAVVNPQTTSTYTLRAFGRRTQVSARVDVTVRQPGGGDGGPVADAGPNQVTTQREVRLDGTRSFHPEGLVIGYSWRAVGRQPELMTGIDTATPTVRFANLAFGEYVFELTVTDSRGRFSKATTRVFFGY